MLIYALYEDDYLIALFKTRELAESYFKKMNKTVAVYNILAKIVIENLE